VNWVSVADVTVLRRTDIDAIVSFAGLGNPAAFEAAPQAAAAVECDIADNIARLAREYGVRRVVYLSTAGAAYGEGWRGGQCHAFSETDKCQPLSVYGQAKLAAESHLANMLGRLSPATALTIVRASNIYGSNYAKGGQQGLVNALIERARQGLPITVYGDGQVYRDYLYASDLAVAIVTALKAHVDGVFNIAYGRSHSILEVISAVEEVMAVRFERISAAPRGFDVKYSAVSITKAEQYLQWRPAIDLPSGIAKIVASD
jgi:UDP-glucose 4-epimerase